MNDGVRERGGIGWSDSESELRCESESVESKDRIESEELGGESESDGAGANMTLTLPLTSSVPDELRVYTYGRSVGSGSRRRIGGYAFAPHAGDVEGPLASAAHWVTSGRITNQLMELAAAAAALRAIDQAQLPCRPVVLVTTSHYVMNCMTLWLPRWERTGWVTKQQRIVQNCGTLREMAQISYRFGVQFERQDPAIGQSDDSIDPGLVRVKRMVDSAIQEADQSGCSKRHDVMCVWMG